MHELTAEFDDVYVYVRKRVRQFIIWDSLYFVDFLINNFARIQEKTRLMDKIKFCTRSGSDIRPKFVHAGEARHKLQNKTEQDKD